MRIDGGRRHKFLLTWDVPLANKLDKGLTLGVRSSLAESLCSEHFVVL